MVHNELHALDLAIIGAYLIAMVLIGLVVVKKVRSMDDYYLGGRSFGPLVLMATVCATIIGGSGLMGRAGVAYSSGFKAIMTALPYLLGMFIFSGLAGRISDVGTKFGVTSIPDLFEQRFGKTAKVVLGCLIAFTMMGTVASQVTATATIINMLGGEIGISYELGALIACAVFIIYTATSGLFGVIYTDVFQFVMLILFVYILIPASSLVKLGGIGNFVQNLAPELAKPYIDGGIVGDIITYFVFTLAGAEMWQRAFAAKNRRSAKEGLFLGTLAYGLTIPLVWFMGVVAHQLVPAEKIAAYGSTDAVVPALAIEILPVGLTGLALAGILSVIMSTADSYLIVSVQTCVHDIYKVFRPDTPERKELRLTRVFAVVLPLGALLKNSRIQKITRFIAGILILLTVSAPLLRLDLTGLADRIAELGDRSGFSTQQVSKDYQTMLRALVQANMEKYIEAKAAALGGIIQAEVTVGSGETPMPESVILTGSMTPAQAQALEDYIRDSLGIPSDRQEWRLYG